MYSAVQKKGENIGRMDKKTRRADPVSFFPSFVSFPCEEQGNVSVKQGHL